MAFQSSSGQCHGRLPLEISRSYEGTTVSMEIETAGAAYPPQGQSLGRRRLHSTERFNIWSVLKWIVFLWCVSASAEVVDLYILAGQSNMAGHGRTNELSESDFQAQINVLFFNHSNVWVTYQPRADTLSSNGFGPEIAIGRTIAASRGRVAAMVKYAVGGTDLFKDWNPHIPGSLYHQMRNKVETSVAALRAEGKIACVAGFFWMQGESDADSSANPSGVGKWHVYEPNLRDLILRVREDFNSPELPFIIGRISNSSEWEQRAVVREAQTNVGQRVANCRVFSTDVPDGFTLFPDDAHYDTESTVLLGERFAQAFLTLPDANSSTNLPRLLRARPGTGLTNAMLTFSKPLAGSAADLGNFTLSGEVRILEAALGTNDLRTINLRTSVQTPGSNYSVMVNGVRDRSTNANLIASNSSASFFAQPRLGARANVPEAADYQLVYALDIPVANPNWNATNVRYSYDAHRSVTQPFSGIAYYLELQPLDGKLQFVFVSMDAFTTNAAAIGVPSIPSGKLYQQYVTNMNVFSNVDGIQTGVGLARGSIEFWPSNYISHNVANIANARNDIYDWGDQQTNGLGYACLQVHNPAARQVLLAYNRWGGTGGNSDLGVGNNFARTNYVGIDRGIDYTFMSNAGNYTIRRLEIFVLPPPMLRGVISGSQLTISWPTIHKNYSLQSAASLQAPVWEAVMNSVQQTNGRYSVVLNMPGANRFYRLAK